MAFKKDTLFQNSLEQIVDFSFDEKTVEVFPDMINRSVPGYSTMISLSAIVASHYVKKAGLVYDLGCSLGASSLSLLRHRQHDDFKIIAVDNSQSMIDKCKTLHVDEMTLPKSVSLSWQCQDILNMELNDCDVIMLNLVLQFIEPRKRQQLLTKLYHSLNKGGALIISEKIQLENTHSNQKMDNWQQYFKKQNGYSDLEISQKRKSIEKNMLLESPFEHVGRFHAVGFSNVTPIFQALNFCTWCVEK